MKRRSFLASTGMALLGAAAASRAASLPEAFASWFAERDPKLKAAHLDRAGDPGAPRAYLDAARMHAERFQHTEATALLDRHGPAEAGHYGGPARAGHFGQRTDHTSSRFEFDPVNHKGRRRGRSREGVEAVASVRASRVPSRANV